MLYLINEQHDIDKIYCMKEIWDLIKKGENVGIKHLNNRNTFTQCSNTIDKNINDYNPIRKRKKIIVFDDMITDILMNKKIQVRIKEMFIRCRKLNISLIFITQYYFFIPRDVRLNTTHYFIVKVNKQIELQNITRSHSADIDYIDFMKIYRKCTREPFNFLTIDVTLPASNPLRFRKKLFESL